jgi:gliding motility-associated-like protein
MRFFPLLIVFITCFTRLEAQVVINEYSCSNRSSFLDNFGEYEDWIELRNTGASAINITGYYLSDNATQPMKWQIPNGVIIPANGFQIFFASGRDLVAGTNYHASFKFSQSESTEEVVFADPSGSIVDSVTIRSAQVGHSRGRLNAGPVAWGVFTAPTPGAANGAGFYGYVARPFFSLNAGFYGAAQTVSLSSPSVNATVRYTVDGSEPTVASPAYTVPMNITNTTMVRAKCFSTDPNFLNSFIETNTYFINVSHTLPVVSVGSADYQNLFNNSMPEIVSSMEYFDRNQVQRFESYGEVDPHGNDSWAYPQKGIDFVVRDQYGYDDEINHQIFETKPRQQFKRIMFKAGASDNYPFGPPAGCHLRDMFIQTLAQKAGLNVDLRSAESCILYINGQYWGLYEIREKVNDPDYTEYYHNQSEEDLDFLSYWGGLNIRYGTDADWIDLYNYVMANPLTVQANYQSVASRIDISNVIDYMIINTFSVNSDWINWNTMWWRGTGTPNVRWRYALWDMDNTFNLGQNFSGWTTTGYQANPCDLDDNFQNVGPNMGHLDIFGKLMQNPDFKAQYINRWSELLNTYLDCSFVQAHLDSIVNVITPEMPAQIARWGGSMADWQNNLTFLRNQIDGRCTVINQGIVDCYQVDGPHRIVFNVDPPGAGSITFNTRTFTTYPDTGMYFGGINGSLTASAAPGYNFWYWEVFRHSLNPDSSFATTGFLIDTIDSIVAHFQQVITHDVTYIVSPAGSGTISINGVSYSNFPFTVNYLPNSPVSITALPQSGYHFLRYSSNHHTFIPSDTVADIFFQVTQRDTVLIVFEPDFRPQLTVIPLPEGACQVRLNGTLPPFYPHDESFSMNQLVELSFESLDEAFEHHYWNSLNHIFSPDSSSKVISFSILRNDTIFLNCKEKEVIVPVAYVPSSFTPNGDGLNDELRVYFSESVISGELLIYDRWGMIVYRSQDLRAARWDGRGTGGDCPQGVYPYILQYTDSKGLPGYLSGQITIFR